MTASMSLVDAVRQALAEVEREPRDVGAVRLAEFYAEGIDADPAQLGKLGPALLAVLESLAMTPKGRAAVLGKGGGGRDHAPKSKADELRERRAAREHAS